MELNYHFDTETFRAAWEEWKQYKKEEFKAKFKTARGEQCQLTYLHRISFESEQIALAIIQRSMGNHYQGLFELPINHVLMQKNGKSNNQAGFNSTANTKSAGRGDAQSFYNAITGQNSQ